MTKLRKQLVVVDQSAIRENQLVEEAALFSPDGSPYSARTVSVLEVNKVTVELSASEISNLNSSPVLLAEAPGIGLAYQVLGVVLVFHPGETAYTNVEETGRFMVGAEAAVAVDYSVWETTPRGIIGVPGLHQGDLSEEFQGVDMYLEMSMNGTQASVPINLVENQPLVAGNPGAEFIDGDATATLTVTYTTFPV